jgi:hypothetical protein
MALTTYLQLDEVRAALGVNDLELKDTVLILPVYEMGLVRELNKISTSLPAAFSAAHSKQAADRTAAEAALYDATHLFAVYAVAKQVGVSLASFAPKDVGDGKATLSRFAGESYKETMDRVEGMFADTRSGLVAAYEAFAGSSSSTPNTTPFTSFIASSRSRDPVTDT